MALIYHSNITRLFIGTLLKLFVKPSNDNLTNPTTNWQTTGITVYKGTKPAPAAITAAWGSYNSSSADYLVHYTDGRWVAPGFASLLQLQLPSVQTPVATGTATWAIVWVDQPTAPQLASTTLPFDNFMVVDVSDIFGTGVIRFTSPNLVSGTPVAITDATIAASL